MERKREREREREAAHDFLLGETKSLHTLNITRYHVQVQPIDQDFQQRFNDIYLQLGGMGERVLGSVLL